MSEDKTYICDPDPEICDVTCIQNYTCKPDGCKTKLWCRFTETTKYQITEVPEPVTVLDIQYPVDAEFIAPAHFLEKFNGKQIKIVESAGLNKHLTICKESGYYFPKSWLKQKPAEPTREKLQIKLDSICEYVKNTDKVSVGASNIIYDLAGM